MCVLQYIHKGFFSRPHCARWGSRPLVKRERVQMHGVARTPSEVMLPPPEGEGEVTLPSSRRSFFRQINVHPLPIVYGAGPARDALEEKSPQVPLQAAEPAVVLPGAAHVRGRERQGAGQGPQIARLLFHFCFVVWSAFPSFRNVYSSPMIPAEHGVTWGTPGCVCSVSFFGYIFVYIYGKSPITPADRGVDTEETRIHGVLFSRGFSCVALISLVFSLLFLAWHYYQYQYYSVVLHHSYPFCGASYERMVSPLN